jgi:hypothetical protein
MFATTALENNGMDVNFWSIWDGGHCADYNIHGVMRWIGNITGWRI